MKKQYVLFVFILATTLVSCGSHKTPELKSLDKIVDVDKIFDQAIEQEFENAKPTGEEYDLSYNLKPGDTFSQEVVFESTLNVATSKQEQNVGSGMTWSMVFTVTAVIDDIISCKVNFTAIQLKFKLPDQELVFSSEPDSENDLLSLMLRGMTAVDFNIDMTVYGEIKAVIGFRELLDKVYSSLNIFGNELAEAKETLEQSINEDGIKEIFQNLDIYPEYPVAVGGSWKKKISNKEMDLENTYLLQRVEGDEMVIKVRSNVTNMKIADFSSTLEGIENGTIVTRRSSGWVKDAMFKREVSGFGKLQGVSGVKITAKMNTRLSE